MLIRSGSFSYLCRVSKDLAAQGYRVIREKKWADGKYTFTFKRFENED